MHGEATSEKVALAKWLDGKVTAVLGTHTHIQTNDARVQPGGTAAITDAGMTGPHDSVIGVQAELAIRAMRTGMPVRFETASGDVRIEGALVECGAGRPRDELRGRARLRAVSAPPIQYAANGDVHIAYQVLGDGPLDLVFVAGAITNLDVLWEMSDYRRACERLASFSRLILFDKRGMGLSDRVRVGTLEERMDDVRAILDAVGSETTALMGVSEGGPMSILFAATYPERTRGLVLCGAEVKEETTDDWPWGEATREEFEEWMDMEGVLARWGKGLWADLSRLAERATHSCASSSDASRCSRRHRTTASPSCAWRSRSTFGTSSPAVTAPTLIVHRVGDKICSVGNARWLARNIEGARYVELAGREPPSLHRRRRHPGRDPGVPDRRARARRAGSNARDGPVHRRRRLDGSST